MLEILCSAIPKTTQVDIGGFSEFLSEHLDGTLRQLMQMNAFEWLVYLSHLFADDMFIKLWSAPAEQLRCCQMLGKTAVS